MSSQKEHTMERCHNNKRKPDFKVSSYSVYNLPSPSSPEPVNTSQKAAAFWLRTFEKVRLVAGRSRTWASRPQTVEGRAALWPWGIA
jgi:hypothetical protein